MATKKIRTRTVRKASRGKGARRPRRAAAPAGAAAVLRERWDAAMAALGEAEATVEKQVKLLMKKNRIKPGDAATLLNDLRSRLQIERKRRMKQFDAGMKQLQSRFKKERKVVGRRLDDAMLATLAALNIPSRREVSDLTSKVETLSRKIDSFRR